MAAQDGVQSLHDLHIWPLSTTRAALAVHLVWHGVDADAFVDRVIVVLADDHGIAHVTLQLQRQECHRAGA